MTVRTLNKEQKNLAARWYQQRLYTSQELADHFKVSVRTINRIIKEKGLTRPGFTASTPASYVKPKTVEPTATYKEAEVFLNSCNTHDLLTFMLVITNRLRETIK